MKTLDIDGAAALLFCSKDRVLELIAREGLPACNKTGRGWVFVDVDLIEWLRAHYHNADERLGARAATGGSAASIRRRYEKALKGPQARRRVRGNPDGGGAT